MTYDDEVQKRLRAACPNGACVLNGPHALHRNKQGNQWVPDGREGVQALCSGDGCVLLLHDRGEHQDVNGALFTLPTPPDAPCTVVRCIVIGAHTVHQNAKGEQWGSPIVAEVTITRDVPGVGDLTQTIRGAGQVVAFREAVAALARPPHSEHYATMKPEPIDVIDGWGLNFNLGCVVKYLARPKGQKIADLEKALWYLQHELEIRRGGAV